MTFRPTVRMAALEKEVVALRKRVQELEHLDGRLAVLEEVMRQQQRGETPSQVCTCAKHGYEFVTQQVYSCETCGLVGHKGCCEICA